MLIRAADNGYLEMRVMDGHVADFLQQVCFVLDLANALVDLRHKGIELGQPLQMAHLLLVTPTDQQPACAKDQQNHQCFHGPAC